MGTPKKCSGNYCDEPAHVGGRCEACYRYFKAHGVERPDRMVIRYQKRKEDLKKKPLWCRVCGNPKLKANFRCDACDRYYRRHKKERPKHLWSDEVNCSNCGRPLAHVARRGELCLGCYASWKYNGVMRPREKWGIGEYGWCDCGEPAQRWLEGAELGLCYGCYELEG